MYYNFVLVLKKILPQNLKMEVEEHLKYF